MTNNILELCKKFCNLRVKCPECNSDQVQLLVLQAYIKAEDLDKDNPPEYYRCRCRICKHKFMANSVNDEQKQVCSN
jgi:hypothetical protein